LFQGFLSVFYSCFFYHLSQFVHYSYIGVLFVDVYSNISADRIPLACF